VTTKGTTQPERTQPERTRRPTAEIELEKIVAFKRVAEGRTNRALKSISMLATTADRSRYLYTEKQAATIVGTLRQAVDRLESAYAQRDRLHVEL
jgi:hypothetical protein